MRAEGASDADPAVAYVLSSIGSGGRTLNQGGLNIRLKPRAERAQVDQIMNELRPKLAAVPGITTFLLSPAASLITGSSLLVDGGWTAQ